MATNNRMAEDAVIQAIEELVSAGKRAYSLSVPVEAQRILLSKERGRVARADALSRIREAIVSLQDRGMIEAHLEPSKDWLICNTADSALPLEADRKWDVFICHASEDKEAFVRPLAEGLKNHGIEVWYDEFTLKIGDSLRRSIDYGLGNSRYGVVVISRNFMHKDWPQRELDGLVTREVGGVKVILPVWHNITAEEIRSYSPTLADRLAASSDEGLEKVITKILEVVTADRGEPPSGPSGTVPGTMQRSDVRVTLQRLGRNDLFIIQNLGPGIVYNVHFEINTQEGKNSPLVEGDYDEKLPIEILRPNAHVELLAALTFGSGATFRATWRWREEDGREEVRNERVSLQSY